MSTCDCVSIGDMRYRLGSAASTAQADDADENVSSTSEEHRDGPVKVEDGVASDELPPIATAAPLGRPSIWRAGDAAAAVSASISVLRAAALHCKCQPPRMLVVSVLFGINWQREAEKR